MQLLVETSESIQHLAIRVAGALEETLNTLDALSQNEKIPGSSKIDSQSFDGKVLRLSEGSVQHFVNNKVFALYEPGDLLLLEDCFECPSDLRTDFAVIVEVFDLSQIQELCSRDEKSARSWTKFLVLKQNYFMQLAASLIGEELFFEPQIKTFTAGEVIIEQGAEDSTVYTMTEGKADVLVDGVKVGEVLTDEIFGAIAALTETARTAQVVATESCLVLALPGEKFVELTRSRPATVSKMVSDMARTIVDLNNRVAAKA